MKFFSAYDIRSSYGISCGLGIIIDHGEGNRTVADLRYGGKDITSPSTLISAPIKG